MPEGKKKIKKMEKLKKEGIIKKFCYLKFFRFVAILTVALVFIGINFVQGKDRPEKVNWGVRIPDTVTKDTVTNMLYAKDPDPSYIYWNNDGDIYVQVAKFGRKYKGEREFYYQFQFILRNPDIWAGFRGVDFYKLEEADLDKCCVFPEHCDLLDPPDCMECFLNGPHPRAGYSELRIAFMIFNKDIEKMVIGDEYWAIDEMDTISFSVWYSSECYQTYHNIDNWVRPADRLFIKRIAENTWRIHVSQELYVRESYCEEVPIGKGKGKKTKPVTYTPLAAWGHFDFQMDWIKNPQ